MKLLFILRQYNHKHSIWSMDVTIYGWMCHLSCPLFLISARHLLSQHSDPHALTFHLTVQYNESTHPMNSSFFAVAVKTNDCCVGFTDLNVVLLRQELCVEIWHYRFDTWCAWLFTLDQHAAIFNCSLNVPLNWELGACSTYFHGGMLALQIAELANPAFSRWCFLITKTTYSIFTFAVNLLRHLWNQGQQHIKERRHTHTSVIWAWPL